MAFEINAVGFINDNASCLFKLQSTSVGVELLLRLDSVATNFCCSRLHPHWLQLKPAFTTLGFMIVGSSSSQLLLPWVLLPLALVTACLYYLGFSNRWLQPTVWLTTL